MPGRTILIIDDDAAFRNNLAEVLKNAGYRALSAADGQEAITLIEQDQTAIDLMIVDLCLPDTNGVEIIRAVTQRKAPIKIIAASGVFDEAYLEMAKIMGADESVRKATADHAITAESWLQVVRRLLGDETGKATEKPSQIIVLLVDDESSVRDYTKTLLQLKGYQVLESADGLDALALFRKLGGAIDLLVTDIDMPRLDGIQLARAVRLESPNMPVVYISGDPLAVELHCPEGGIAFVPKPFLPDALWKAVWEVLTTPATSPGA